MRQTTLREAHAPGPVGTGHRGEQRLVVAQDAEEDGRLKAAPVLQEAKKKIGPKRIILRSECFDQRPAPSGRPGVRREPRARGGDRSAQPPGRDRAGRGPEHGQRVGQIGPAPILNGQIGADFQQPTPVSGRTSRTSRSHPSNLRHRLRRAAAQGGALARDDGGANWTPIFDGDLGSLATGALALDPSNRKSSTYGTGEPGTLSADSFFGVGRLPHRQRQHDREPRDPSTRRVAAGSAARQVHAAGPSATIAGGPHELGADLRLPPPAGGPAGGSRLHGPAPFAMRGIYTSTDGGTPPRTPASQPGRHGRQTPRDDPAAGPAHGGDALVRGHAERDTVSGGLWISVDNGDIWTSGDALPGIPAPSITTLGLTATGCRGLATTSAARSDALPRHGTQRPEREQGGRVRRSTDGGATWVRVRRRATSAWRSASTTSPSRVDPRQREQRQPRLARGPLTPRRHQEQHPPLDRRRRHLHAALRRDRDAGLHVDTHAIAIAQSEPERRVLRQRRRHLALDRRGTTWPSRNNTEFPRRRSSRASTLHPTDREFMTRRHPGQRDRVQAAGRQPGLRADFGDGGYARDRPERDRHTNVIMYHTYFNQSNSHGRRRRARPAASPTTALEPASAAGSALGERHHLQPIAISSTRRSVWTRAPAAPTRRSTSAPTALALVRLLRDRLRHGSARLRQPVGCDRPAGRRGRVQRDRHPSARLRVATHNVRVAGTSNGRRLHHRQRDGRHARDRPRPTRPTRRSRSSRTWRTCSRRFPSSPGTPAPPGSPARRFYGFRDRQPDDAAPTAERHLGAGRHRHPGHPGQRDRARSADREHGCGRARTSGSTLSSDNGLTWTLYGRARRAAVFDLRRARCPRARAATLAVTHGERVAAAAVDAGRRCRTSRSSEPGRSFPRPGSPRCEGLPRPFSRRFDSLAGATLGSKADPSAPAFICATSGDRDPRFDDQTGFVCCIYEHLTLQHRRPCRSRDCDAGAARGPEDPQGRHRPRRPPRGRLLLAARQGQPRGRAPTWRRRTPTPTRS